MDALPLLLGLLAVLVGAVLVRQLVNRSRQADDKEAVGNGGDLDGARILCQPPRYCPRWLWWMTAGQPTCVVDGKTLQLRWREYVAVDLDAPSTQVRVHHPVQGWPTANIVDAEISRGNTYVYPAKWECWAPGVLIAVERSIAE